MYSCTLMRSCVCKVHLGNQHAQREYRQVGGDALGAVALGGEVHLALQRARQLAHQLARPVGLQRRHLGLGHRGEAVEQAQIGLDDVADAGAADLHHHLAAVALGCARCTWRWTRRPAARRRSARTAPRVRRPGPHATARADRQRHGRHLAVQARKLGDPVRAEQVSAAGGIWPSFTKVGPSSSIASRTCTRRLEAGEVGGVIAVQRVAGAPAHQPEPSGARCRRSRGGSTRRRSR